MSSSLQGPQTESALINRAIDGDRHAFYALLQPCEGAIFRAAWAILNNDADAEDTAQQAVLKAFAGLKDFHWETKFSAWIVRITIEQARLKLRSAGRASSSADGRNQADDYTPGNLSPWTKIPGEALQDPHLRDALTQAIAGLDEQARSVFVLRDVEKFSLAETAEILGIGEAGVRLSLARARLRVRDALAPGMDAGWATKELSARKATSW